MLPTRRHGVCVLKMELFSMPTSMYTNAQWCMIHDDWVASGKAQTTYLNSGMCERFIKATFGSAAAVPSYATFNQHMKTISESAYASASGNSTTQKKPQTPTSSVSHTSSSANKVTVSRESCSSRTAPASSSIFSPEQQSPLMLLSNQLRPQCSSVIWCLRP